MRKLIQAVAIMLMPVAGVAQDFELRSLSEYLMLPDDRRDEAYPLLRCIGLFQGMFIYGGANFSEEVHARAEIGNEAMAFFAFTMREQRYPERSQDDLASQMQKEIEDISNNYSSRMTKNYSLTGEAWGSDQVILDDLETCGPVVQYAVDRINEIRGN